MSHSSPARVGTPLLGALRRRWPIVLLLALLVPAATLTFALTETPRHRSVAKVLISDQDLASIVAGAPDAGLDYTGRTIATEAQIAGSTSVTDAARARAGDPASPVARTASIALRVANSATSSGESNILNVVVDSEDPQYSQRLAGAVADEYVAFRSELTTRQIRTAREQLAERIAELQRSGETDGQLFADLNDRLQQLDTLITLGSSRANVLEGGSTPEQVSPQPLRAGMLGLLVGLLAGVAAAIGRDRFDRRVKSQDEVAEILSLPVLGALPNPKRRNETSPHLVAQTEPSGPGAEAFRMLRTHIKFALAARGGRRILITSAAPSEGKTFTAANLAVTAAASGDDVILVDLDLRRSNLHAYMRVLRKPGVTDVVAGDVDLEDALVELSLPPHASAGGRLRLLPAGARIPNPGEFVSSEGVTRLLHDVSGATSGLVIIDTPPMLGVGDATALAGSVDATIMVVNAGMASWQTLQRARHLLLAGAHRPLGVALTAAWGGRLGYGEPYGYASRESPAPDERLADVRPPY